MERIRFAPWVVGGGDLLPSYERRVIRGSRGEYLARINPLGDREEEVARAALISAAPELAEALLTIVKMGAWNGRTDCDFYVKASAALAKAGL